MTSRNVANLIPDPAVSSWCLLSGVCFPTVLLSKFKLYGSAKESCHHSGSTAGWHILLERAGHWRMTETGASEAGWLGVMVCFFSLVTLSCLRNVLWLTFILYLWVRQKSTRGSCLPPSWGKDWILGGCYKKKEIQQSPREEAWRENERLTMAPHSPATPSETEFWSPQEMTRWQHKANCYFLSKNHPPPPYSVLMRDSL